MLYNTSLLYKLAPITFIRRMTDTMKKNYIIYLLLLLAILSLAFTSLVKLGENNEMVFSTNDFPTVIDGDTIKLTFRLIGVDTPEMKQKCKKDGKCYNCGAEAKQFLETLIRNESVE